MSITIIGLGPGDAGMITRAAWARLEQAQRLYLRTRVHPTVGALPGHLELHDFDQLYEQAADFGAVYAQIAALLVERAERGEALLYAVPGDPLTAEATTRHIRALARERGVALQILPGVSFIEPACALLEIDPLEQGLQLIDALDMTPTALAPSDAAPTATPDSWASLHGHTYEPPLRPFPLTPTRPALICQVYSRRIASDLKLSLMERYPDQHLVTIVRAAGVAGEEQLLQVPLYQIDHHDQLDHLTCLFVPALTPLQDLRGADGLAHIVDRLLAPYGCPWDREQTPQSLRSALLNETHEVLEALDGGDSYALAEELGDLMMNILSQAEMARQAGEFSAGDLYEAVATKLIRRHPHVFGDLAVAGSGEVLQNWEAIKQAERAEQGRTQRGPLDGIPPSTPALATAQELARKAARVGFVWPDAQHAWRKVYEEIAEIEEVLSDTTLADERAQRLEHELGDLLLAAAVAARALGVDAESALRTANARFRARFTTMQQLAAGQGAQFQDLSLPAMLDLWQAAKQER